MIGAGLERGAQSLADAIVQHKRDLDEKKGLRLVLQAHAADPNSGIDPERIDKMSIGEAKGAILASELRRQQAAGRAQAQATAAIPGFVDAIAENQRPQPAVRTPDSMFMDLAGGGVPGTTLGAWAGMDPRSAFADALKRFSPVLNDPDVRKSILGAAIKNGLVQPKVPQFTTDPSGKPIAIDPSGRVQWAPGKSGESFFDKNKPVEDLPGMKGYKRIPTGPNTAQIIFNDPEAGPIALTGPNGEDLGFGLRGKAGVTPLKQPNFLTDEELLKHYDRQEQNLVNNYSLPVEAKAQAQAQIDAARAALLSKGKKGKLPAAVNPKDPLGLGL